MQNPEKRLPFYFKDHLYDPNFGKGGNIMPEEIKDTDKGGEDRIRKLQEEQQEAIR